MRELLLALAAGAALAGPAPAQDITEDLAFALRCHFTRSCIGGGCGDEDYDLLLEIDGAGAILRDAQLELPLTGAADMATGQLSFVSEPVDNTSYFISVFEDGGAVFTIHTQAEGTAIGLTFDGACREDS